MGVSFAKNKDASKLLKQALQRQRNSSNKFGIGYSDEPTDDGGRDRKNKKEQLKLSTQQQEL